MSAAPNPYKSPSVVDMVSPQIGGCTHHWKGRTFTVSSHATPLLLWMENAFIVTIDNAEIYRQSTFHLDCPFRFRFVHDGRTIDAQVKREWGFFARRLKYELIVDGESVAKSRAPIDRWERGVALMLACNAVIFMWLAWRAFVLLL